MGSASDHPLNVVWCGSIPHYLEESDLLYELAAYGIRPSKAVLRHRREGEDMYIYTYIIKQLLYIHSALRDHHLSAHLDGSST